jgi:hypothetical protein
VAAVIWGWGVAQYPELLPGTMMTLTSTGTPHATLVAIIWLSASGALIVGHSYALLFALQGRQVLQAGDEKTDFPARPGSRGERDRRPGHFPRIALDDLPQWRCPQSTQQPEGRHSRLTVTNDGERQNL